VKLKPANEWAFFIVQTMSLSMHHGMNAQTLIDGLQLDLDRMRNIDPALRASMIARLEELRALEKAGD